jgi:hypothetical protein
MLLIDEDISLVYYFLNWRPEFNPRLIVWPHISLRAAVQVWRDIFQEFMPIVFQFPIDPDSILEKLIMPDQPPPLELWIDHAEVPPRPATLTNLASVRPRHAKVYVLELGDYSIPFISHNIEGMLRYIGLGANFRIEFVTPHTEFDPGWDVVVLYMPADSSPTKSFERLLNGILFCGPAPILISARVALVIQENYANVWRRIFPDGQLPGLQENQNFLDGIVWEAPSPTLLPLRRDLFAWEPREGKDWFLQSIPFTATPTFR